MEPSPHRPESVRSHLDGVQIPQDSLAQVRLPSIRRGIPHAISVIGSPSMNDDALSTAVKVARGDAALTPFVLRTHTPEVLAALAEQKIIVAPHDAPNILTAAQAVTHRWGATPIILVDLHRSPATLRHAMEAGCATVVHDLHAPELQRAFAVANDRLEIIQRQLRKEIECMQLRDEIDRLRVLIADQVRSANDRELIGGFRTLLEQTLLKNELVELTLNFILVHIGNANLCIGVQTESGDMEIDGYVNYSLPRDTCESTFEQMLDRGTANKEVPPGTIIEEVTNQMNGSRSTLLLLPGPDTPSLEYYRPLLRELMSIFLHRRERCGSIVHRLKRLDDTRSPDELE